MKAEIDDQWAIDDPYYYESDAYMKLIERVSDLSEKFYAIEEVNYEAEVEKILRFRFCSWRFYKTNSEFSEDGECELSWLKFFCKTRFDFIDEPTITWIESIQWLEDFLINSAKQLW
jgi:ATP-binding cassette subfamily F protein 3